MIVKYAGLTAETSEMLEQFRSSPKQTDDELIRYVCQSLTAERMPKRRAATASLEQGCDLGSGVVLGEGERVYCFLYRDSLDAQKPEGIAIAQGGALYIDGQKVERSKGSLVQPALQIVQRRVSHVSPTTGNLVCRDAWEAWYAQREGRLLRVGDLRPKHRIARRHRKLARSIGRTAAELGL